MAPCKPTVLLHEGIKTMFITCPLCGDRDSREFTYKGDAIYANRPNSETWSADWDNYLHNRENPAGRVSDLWYHGAGCGAWVVVDRDTLTHQIYNTRLASRIASQ
jgi:sarcosine oxidase subunit delta